MFFLAGLSASVIAWILNRIVLHWFGNKVLMIAPLIEELAKTTLALVFNASVVLTHGVFGLVEGLYDAWGNETKGLKAGFISITGHLFYGYLTAQVWQGTKKVWMAVLTSIFVHFLWNVAVIRFIVLYKKEER